MQYKPIPAIPVLPAIYASTAADFLEASLTGDRREPSRNGRPPACLEICDEETVIRMMWAIAEEYPCYGHRRVTMELRRRGLRVNHKKVRRIMREEGLCPIPFRHRPPVTEKNRDSDIDADSGKVSPVTSPEYPNLVKSLDIVRPNQVWAADITCIRLEYEFVFLAAILDVYTRRCIGWSLDRIVHEEHILRAVRKALRLRKGDFLSGLILHSDQGMVYNSRNYAEFLEGRGIRISVSRRGYPYDNAYVERFFETLKYEEIYLEGYRTFGEALEGIREFIEGVYNTKRLHSALGYRTPLEFE
jgi:transposase InsO family protein